jgi:hypothetical protein
MDRFPELETSAQACIVNLTSTAVQAKCDSWASDFCL